MPQGDASLNDLQRRPWIDFYLMIDLSTSEVGMLRKWSACYRRTRRSGRVVGGVVLVVMAVMVFVILVGFAGRQRDLVQLHHCYFTHKTARSWRSAIAFQKATAQLSLLLSSDRNSTPFDDVANQLTSREERQASELRSR